LSPLAVFFVDHFLDLSFRAAAEFVYDGLGQRVYGEPQLVGSLEDRGGSDEYEDENEPVDQRRGMAGQPGEHDRDGAEDEDRADVRSRISHMSPALNHGSPFSSTTMENEEKSA
jgi:hypothetical protein